MNYQHYQILDYEHHCLHCTYGYDKLKRAEQQEKYTEQLSTDQYIKL